MYGVRFVMDGTQASKKVRGLCSTARYGAHEASLSMALYCPPSGVQPTHWSIDRCGIARNLVAVT